MNLFDTDGRMEDVGPGYRMRRLEVYNWGTFDGAVWPFELGGNTSLLTGEIGSGKSTLVDAILTLLIPQPKINYNKAADSGIRERSLTSYVRGYYAKRSNASGEEEPVALRDKNKYSVILAVFSDVEKDSYVTLAQVFFFQPGSERPARFFVVAERSLSIKKDFGGFGNNISDLKKRLKKSLYVEVFNDYTSYAVKFKSLFGIVSDDALDLFQQTVSMKKVNGITDFVRKNMLGDVDRAEMEENIQHLLTRFHDLKSIHDAIVRDREKMDLLRPIVKASDTYDACLLKESEFSLMEEGVQPYLAREEIKLLTEALTESNRQQEEMRARRTSFEAELTHALEDIDAKKKEMWQNGGNRLHDAEKELKNCEKDLAQVMKQAENYRVYADVLGLSVPVVLEDFLTRRKELEDLLGELKAEYEALDAKKFEADSKEREIAFQISADKTELASLLKRDSNIPAPFIAIRKDLCCDLKVAERDMPFAGEIMEVKPEEQKWEGALERLLGEFGVSLLVPESLYGKVIDWMEKHFLGRRMVYYRVDEYTPPVSMTDLPETSAARKLHIKRDSPYAGWLASELVHRFDHVCAETTAEFKKARFALSLEGQIKTQGRRHQKDDRHELHDRRYYVLGFSNKEKIALIRKELERLEGERAAQRKIVQQIVAERESVIRKRNAAENLLVVDNFKDIDCQYFADRVDKQKAIIQSLKGHSNILARLDREVKALEKEKKEIEEAIRGADGELGSLARQIQEYEDKKAADERILCGAPELIRREGFDLLDKHREDCIKKGFFTLKSMTEKQGMYNKWIREEKEKWGAKKEQSGSAMSSGMSKYLQYLSLHNESDPNLTNELNRANRSEYKELYRRIGEDDLPKLLPKFKKRLRENTIQDMAIFQSKLLSNRDVIRERIEEINRSLYDIDYNVGHYIEIECIESLNSEIKHFRQQLKACTDSAITGSDDNYNEEKFLEIEKILSRFSKSRPGRAEEDKKWTAMVTDVRNWYTFAVSERIRMEDGRCGEEYEHYTDSSGKSGGQKEKLAYTILAASFVYSFGIIGSRALPTFRFTAIDEAFLKSSDESARFGLELFRKMGLQLLVVTPLAKIPTIEPYISHLGFVSQNEKRQSQIRNLSIGEYRKELKAREKKV